MIKNQEFTYIGKSSNIKGHFDFSGPTHIKGNLIGEIFNSSPNTLTIEVGAKVEGKIKGCHIEIYGNFTGEIEASGKVTFYSTANFSGKLISNSIEILPGAIVNMDGQTEISGPSIIN